MTDDLVERLRARHVFASATGCHGEVGYGPPAVQVEAAAEIERLRALPADMPARSVRRIMADQQAEIENLRAQVARLREALAVIAGIGEGSTTANSLPHIGRLARAALKETE